ncbi:hypothetical protein KFL_006370040 [Klebsormidium nitens]|uniref:Protein SirB1 N-terminal domain-containing protein n=1 Tax=Klebsormidium nitens TaxID=105231 RepID=A0A1Y1ILU5_KLENI|nr:hypothetical protein KFL_006370040 [Klebsormidium nitens]|eukprot:GAQ90419.1 hypothetical protein KFL_006370040 [Klebsormidium nitens]
MLLKESHTKLPVTSVRSMVLHQMGKNTTFGHIGACAGLKKTDLSELPAAVSSSGGACRFGSQKARFGGSSYRLVRWVCASTGGTDAVEVGDQCSDGQSVELDGQPQRFVLHDLMHNDGVSVEYSKAARANFAVEAARAITNDPTLDLARAALEIAAEDDALVSHSVVPLPVESYLSRLDVMAAEVANHHLPTSAEERTPRAVFDALNKYLFVYQGFKRAQMRTRDDPRESYLNGVLTRRVGTSMMLALIYSDIAQRLLRWGFIDFQVQMQLPSDPITLPQPQAVRDDGAEGASPNEDNEFDLDPDLVLRGEAVMLTPVLLLAEVLTALKRAYWPWRWHRTNSTGSGFLEAAEAAARGGEGAQLGAGLLDNSEAGRGSGAEIAAARSAKYRLKRGIWTSVGAGDLRRALAASERLCLLGLDNKDLRDYGVLLFHCGQYKQAYHFLETYQAREGTAGVPSLFNPLAAREGAALRALMERLTLILAERAWYAPAAPEPKEPPADPW